MIEFKLNGKKMQIPSSWDDINMGQYLQFLELKDDYLQLVSIVSGTDYETIKKATIVGLDRVIQALNFMRTLPKFEGIVDKCGKYKLPHNSKGQFDIQFESLAQFEDMRAVIKTCVDTKSIVAAYVKFVAIYLQKIRDGEYDYSKAQSMESEVLLMPAKEVCTTGAFFYVKLNSLLNGTNPTSRPTNQNPKSSTRGSRKSVKRLARR